MMATRSSSRWVRSMLMVPPDGSVRRQSSVAKKTFFVSVKCSAASGPSSRPRPEAFMPPNGVAVAHRRVRVHRQHAGLRRRARRARHGRGLGPDRAGQAVGRVVGEADRVGLVVEGHHGDDGAEDLLAARSRSVGVGEHARSAANQKPSPSGAVPRNATSRAVEERRDRCRGARPR